MQEEGEENFRRNDQSEESESLGRQRATLDVEIRGSSAHEEDPAERGTDESGTRRLASKSASVEQRQDSATSTRSLDRKEKSELSNFLIEKPAAEASLTGHTMMQGKSGKAATSSSFSERLKNTLGYFLLPWEPDRVTRLTLRKRVIITKKMLFQ